MWVSTRETETPFERLFIAEYGTVVAIAQRVLGDAHEAEDVAQEVFYSFYRSHSPSASYAGAWLHRAAAHAALNLVRGRRRRRLRESAQAMEGERLRGAGQSSLDPQNEVVAAEGRDAVRKALGRLPKKSATVLVLRYSGLSYAEIGTALGVGTGQIGTLLRRAEAAFGKEMSRGTPR